MQMKNNLFGTLGEFPFAQTPLMMKLQSIVFTVWYSVLHVASYFGAPSFPLLYTIFMTIMHTYMLLLNIRTRQEGLALTRTSIYLT